MRYRTFALAAALLAVTAAGCNQKPETKAEAPVAVETPAPAPAPAETPISVAEGFHHQADFEAAGYYLSPTAFRVGNYAFTHIGVGMPSDFETWEGGDRSSTFGPILIAFDDVTSPKAANELGGEGHSVTLRVLPQAYSFDAGKMTFRGADPKLGEVLFSGVFDKAALLRAQASGSSQEIVLSGDLMIGAGPTRKVSFTYWVGD
ncbi:MAG: hypothetical protein Q8L23_00280 [Caulobacter sp.]|nr:hypothetical protein [Caulobacter sp.]